MAAYFHNDIYDLGLSELDTDANALHICTQQPATYAEATSTYTKGNKTSITVSAPGARAGGGREVTISAITDGAVTGDGTVTHYALVDTGTSRLLVAQSLSASKAVNNGDVFTVASFKVGIPAPS